MLLQKEATGMITTLHHADQDITNDRLGEFKKFALNKWYSVTN
jgi:hypothetical protein